MGERTGATLRLAAWSFAVVAAGRLLVATGDGELAVPLTSLAALEAWIDHTPPPEMAIAVLRLVGLGACAYLLAVTALGVVARRLRLRSLAGAVDRVSPRLVRRLVAGGSGAGLVLGTVVAALPMPDLALRPPGATVAAAPGSGARAPARATMTRVGRSHEASATTAPAAGNQIDARRPGAARAAGHPGDPDPARADDTSAPSSDPEAAEATMTRVAQQPRSATMHRLEVPRLDATAGPPPSKPVPGGALAPTGPPPTPSAASAPSPPAPAPPAPTAPAPALPSVDPGVWVVEPGDSLWSIAAEVVHTDGGASGEAAVAAYWRALVAENRARLVDPDNPDLLLPGQRLVVPPATR